MATKLLTFTNYEGLLFVGDPHVWSKGPGKRLDSDIFSSVVLGKIEQAVNIAIERNLYLVFLGDLFHVHTENNITLLTKLIRILKKLPNPPVTVEGNHEKSQTKLSDDVALSMLREAGVIHTIEKSDWWGHFIFKDKSEAYVGSTPYGEKIPTEINKHNENATHIWLTHHDLDFGNSYPGVIPLKEIKGVDILVNGHIHQTKKPITVGKMKAHNPGNITRLSIDCKDHVPAVWQWKKEQNQELEAIDLIFEKHIFDLSGKHIEIEDIKPIMAEEYSVQQTSQFVEKMNEHAKEYDPRKTDDGAYLKDNIQALGKVMQLDSKFLDEILGLVDETLENENKK